MYDPSTSKRDESPTVYIPPTYVAFGTLIATFISVYVPYKLLPGVAWQLPLGIFVIKLYHSSVLALLYWMIPSIRPHYKSVRPLFFFILVMISPMGFTFCYPFVLENVDRVRAALAVSFVCDIATFQLTKRCGRPSFCPEDKEWDSADDVEKLNSSRSV